MVSKTLDFELDTFIACSTFFGPSSVNEVELLPLKGYFPSNWPTNSKYYYAHFNFYLKKMKEGVPVLGAAEMNPTRNYAGSIPGPAQWVKYPALP